MKLLLPQNRLQRWCNDSEFPNGVFTRRWYYYPDWITKLSKPWTDTSIAGIREGNIGFTVFPGVYHDPYSGQLAWYCVGADYNDSSGNTVWEQLETLTPVPSNTWFKLDTYYYRHTTDGIFKMWIDNKLIFDLSKTNLPNIIKPGIPTGTFPTRGFINPTSEFFLKISDLDVYQPNIGDVNFPIYQYVDDVEIWNGIPCSELGLTLNIS